MKKPSSARRSQGVGRPAFAREEGLFDDASLNAAAQLGHWPEASSSSLKEWPQPGHRSRMKDAFRVNGWNNSG